MSLNTPHGGDLDLIERMYNIPRKNIMDFSGNINPLGIPESAKNAIIKNIDKLSTYPDVNYINLKNSIADYTGTDPKNILVGNGSTELITAFIKSVKAKKSVIVSPAYSEYEREVKLSGSEIYFFPLLEKDNFNINLDNLFKFLNSEIDLFIMCNPNNPTGTCLNKDEISQLLIHCKKNNILVMIDETYVEFTDDDKNISCVCLADKFDNLFIIRGTSKFFACPGLRLGYGITSNYKILNIINKNKDPWSVNILATIAGEIMFQDKKFINDTKKLISSERHKIIDELKTWKNIKLYQTQSNFILIKITNKNINAPQIFSELIKYNIVIRDASDFAFLGSSYLRFCILSPEKNKLLLEKLKIILNE